MLTTFKNTQLIPVFTQALMLSNFDTIRAQMLAAIQADANFATEQKLAIRLAGAEMQSPGPWDHAIDELLLSIINMTWEEISADGVSALLPEQREAIIQGIMAICKGIIQAEADRLSTLAASDTSLPTNWNTPDPEAE